MSTTPKNPDNVQTVDASKHAKLRVKPDPVFSHAKQQHVVSVTLTELALVSSNFPIVFIKRPTDGRYLLVAMLGLRSGENVYYDAERWESTYVPLAIQRAPFLIGYDDRLTEATEITTCIEIDNPSVSEQDGVAMFTEAGQETDFLQSRHQMLNHIFESQKVTDRFIQTVTDLGLITPVTLLLQQNGEVRNVAGLFALDETKLRQLTAEQIQNLYTNDFLAPCYITLVSLHQVNRLIRLRNGKTPDQITNFQIKFESETPAPAPAPTAA